AGCAANKDPDIAICGPKDVASLIRAKLATTANPADDLKILRPCMSGYCGGLRDARCRHPPALFFDCCRNITANARFPWYGAIRFCNRPRGVVMKKLHIASAAFLATVGIASSATAADLAAAPRLRAVAPVVACTWCGFYVGGNLGYD